MTMQDETEPASLADDAEALAREIRRHATVLSGPRDIEEIIAAIDGVRTAARRYVGSVLAQTGWVNVFANLETGTGAGTQHDAPIPDDGHPVVSYRSRYRLRIHDLEAARRLLGERSEQARTGYDEEYDGSCTGVIAGLAEIDGWDPYRYDQDVIEVVSAGWEAEMEGEPPAG
jgi:hypothetical protein